MGNGRSNSDVSVTSSHSFSSRKASNAKGKVIVVKQKTNTGDPSCSKNDATLKRFLGIPKFFPILKTISQPGLRDQPEAICKVNAYPLLKFAYRLQEHLSRCANVVVMEQESLGNSVKNVDRDTALLLVQFGNRKRSVDRFRDYLGQISDLQMHILNLRFLYRDLLPMTKTLNEMLPEQMRLPLIDIDCLVNAAGCSSEERHNEIIQQAEGNTYSMDKYRIQAIDEVVVVDKNNTS